MLFDDLHPDAHGDSRKPARFSKPDRALSDREVPLGPPSTTISTAVHAWLDGSTPERDARRGERSKDVEFWKRMENDLDGRRRMRTPAYLNAQIMDSIPRHAPQVITPWWRREFVVTPSSAIVTMATLMAAASAATALVLRVPR
ncbi:hypothetical protein BH09GEM1_BH09GEM1_35070 [soil metagenome]